MEKCLQISRKMDLLFIYIIIFLGEKFNETDRTFAKC